MWLVVEADRLPNSKHSNVVVVARLAKHKLKLHRAGG